MDADLQLGGSNRNDYKAIYQIFADNGLLKPNEPIRICEVGCWIGEMTILFSGLAKISNGKVYSIDWFKGNPEGRYTITAETLDVKKIALEHLKYCGANNVEVIKDTSVNASKLFKDGFFDFIYIDADHAYEEVKQDIEHWYPKVKLGGFIGGHDYLPHKSVRSAVNEKLKNVKNIDRNWYYKKEKE